MALRRSGFTCPVTKFIDTSSPHYDPENDEHIGVTLDGAHIIPHALRHTKNGEDDEHVNLPTFPFPNLQRNWQRRIWDAINIFAGEDVQSTLQGPEIDSIANIICLEKNCHTVFGNFSLWFEEDPVSNGPINCSNSIFSWIQVSNGIV